MRRGLDRIYGSCIYNYLCNQCLSPLTRDLESRSRLVYSMQHYAIKFVSDLRQVGGFLRVLRFLPPIKLTATITEILFKVAVNTITLTLLNIDSGYKHREWL